MSCASLVLPAQETAVAYVSLIKKVLREARDLLAKLVRLQGGGVNSRGLVSDRKSFFSNTHCLHNIARAQILDIRKFWATEIKSLFFKHKFEGKVTLLARFLTP